MNEWSTEERLVEEAVEAIGKGRPVVLPTDTVYGLCTTPLAPESLAQLKGRGADQPIALLASEVDILLKLVPELPDAIVRSLLPGRLTLIFRNPGGRFPLLSPLDTIGVRVPVLRGAARRIVTRVGAVAATSANLHGGPDPRQIDKVPEEIRERAVLIDGGELPGIPSTVVDLTGPEPTVLREGAVPATEVSSGSNSRAEAYDPGMAVAHETLEQLRTAGLAEIDPEIAELLGKELERQRSPDRAHRVRELHVAEHVRGRRQRAHEQVRGGLSGQALLRRLRRRRRDRADRDRPREGPLRSRARRTSSRTQAPRRTWPSTSPCSQPGDTILSLELSHGGHLTHGLKVNFSGRLYTIAHYGVSRETNMVDYEDVLELARKHEPKLIVCGGSAYPRTVETDKFRAIADEVDALLLCDMAHFAGLVAAGLHPNPVEHCDFVTSTTHKTLAGPRAGFILCREEHAQAVDRAVFPGMQGGPLMHTIAAKAACSRSPRPRHSGTIRARCARTPTPSPRRSRSRASTSSRAARTRICSSSTCAERSGPGKAAEERLDEVKLTVNRNTVPFDEQPPTIASGVRIGTPAATMRGFDEDDFREVGEIIADALGAEPNLARSPPAARRSARNGLSTRASAGTRRT